MYTLLDINLLNIKQAMKNYIRVDEANVIKQEHPRFNSNKEESFLCH